MSTGPARHENPRYTGDAVFGQWTKQVQPADRPDDRVPAVSASIDGLTELPVRPVPVASGAGQAVWSAASAGAVEQMT